MTIEAKAIYSCSYRISKQNKFCGGFLCLFVFFNSLHQTVVKSISGHSDKIFYCFWSLGNILLTFLFTLKVKCFLLPRNFMLNGRQYLLLLFSSIILCDQFLKVRVRSFIASLERRDAFAPSPAGALLCQAVGTLPTHRSAQDRRAPGWDDTGSDRHSSWPGGPHSQPVIPVDRQVASFCLLQF